MRLKKLIVQGFKSFADRTEFVFDMPITGIVGPNGCGKSNVVDAFKWVLGEQSAKSLRGDAMMDVIFNGADTRKPSGMAEVMLVFANPKRQDDQRVLNLDVDEVAVGRRLFRDGTSEYHLNNSVSRLKDVRELFLDTGVGVDAYSVIEQGRVAAMLDANPAERRLIFEEAAGISKYKVKKKEAERKLEKVDQNLLRVNDIVEEVEKRLRSVKVQAGRARTFKEHTTRLTELRLSYALQEYHQHRQQLDTLEKQCEETQFQLDDIAGDLAASQTSLNEQREQADALSQQKQRLEFDLVQAQAAVQSAQQRQNYARQQLQQLGEQLESFETDQTTLTTRLAEVEQSLIDESARLKSLSAELEQGRQQIEENQQAFRDGQLRLNSIHQEIEQNKSTVLDLMRKLAAVSSRLGAIEIERRNIASQQQRLGDRRKVVVDELSALDAVRQDQQQKLDAVLVSLADGQGKLEAGKQESAALGRQIAQVGEQLGAAREHRSGLLSRQNLLKDLEAKREGVSEGVQSILRQRETVFPFIRGLVADVLRVDVEHAAVIEAALDGRDQWLLTSDHAAALTAGEQLNDLEGRVNVLCTDRFQQETIEAYDWNQHPQRLRLAADLVKFDPADSVIVQHLLGRTAIVDDLATAAELQHVGPSGWRYVTSSSEVLEADGTVRAGPLSAAMGLISRRSELEALHQQIAEVDARIADYAGQVSQANAAVKELEEQQNTLRNTVYQANTAKVQLTSQMAQTSDKQNSLRREEPLLDRELATLLEHAGRLTSDEQQLTQQKSSLDAQQAQCEKTVQELTVAEQTLAEELKTVGESLTAARVELGQVQEKQLASQQQVQRQTSARAEMSQQVARIKSSIESVIARRSDVEQELEAATQAEKVLEQKQAAYAQQIEAIAGRASAAAEAVAELSAKVDERRTQHGDIERQLHQVQIKAGELKVRLETLVSRTLEELQLDLPARYADFTAQTDIDWNAIAEEIKELREKIQRLGNVNLDAITELDELEQRQNFLATQLTDLSSSKKQLEELIDTINKESGIRFEQTFAAVREHFQGMFRKLFGGGKADVYLETELEDATPAEPIVGPDGQMIVPQKKKIDPLDAGIEIIARPPGKQPATISQLSGGEKTMTCIALLMSIFKSKPSPFCILDEVDAALDEANNQRFNMIVQEFLDLSQFIVITHSKRTMQIADVLYGVTMQEHGVSKRVAVKFDQIDSKGQIAESAIAAA
jgi:chromosome segregation protein